MLSAEELRKRHQGHSGDVSGEYSVCTKHGDMDRSFQQFKQLQSVYKALEDRVSEEKIDKLGSLCIGEYDDTCKQVIVKTVKGRVWSHFGYSVEGTMKLYPEEAFFLMDVGTLRVYFNGMPLSLQEALHYFLMSESAITMDHYLVYNYLNRMGYIVRRTVKCYNTQHDESNYATKRKQTDLEIEKSAKSLKSVEINEDFSLDGSQVVKVAVDSNKISQINVKEVVARPDEYEAKLTKFDYSKICFPKEGGMEIISTESPMETDSDNKTSGTYCQKTSEDDDNCVKEQTDQPGQFSLLDYCETKDLSTAETWREFKKEHKHRLQKGWTENLLPKERHTPLVSECTMFDDISLVLDKLQLSKSSNQQLMDGTAPDVGSLMYDVHRPNPNFKKSSVCTPNYRVLVTTPESAPPSLPELLILQATNDNIPVYHAVSDSGDISFYCFTQECIPPDLYQSSKPRKRKRTANKKLST